MRMTTLAPFRLSLAVLCLCACLTPPARAADPNGVPAPDGTAGDPEAERRAFKVADGFDVNLFASDPMLVKPIAMNFDERGRLWVVSSTTYPQVRPGDVPND